MLPIVTIFGLMSVLIGAIGIYGTMAFVVAQQVRAIGLRLALGASPARILRSVIRDAAWHVSAGIGLGLVSAWATSGLFASLVFGIGTSNPMVYLAVTGILGAVGLIAALVPARRAAGVDPLVALRAQ